MAKGEIKASGTNAISHLEMPQNKHLQDAEVTATEALTSNERKPDFMRISPKLILGMNPNGLVVSKISL